MSQNKMIGGRAQITGAREDLSTYSENEYQQDRTKTQETGRPNKRSHRRVHPENRNRSNQSKEHPGQEQEHPNGP